jgi:hypothetical protein
LVGERRMSRFNDRRLVLLRRTRSFGFIAP